VRGAVQTPQVSVPPQPSGMVPQFFPWAAQVVGVQGAGAGAGALATTPDQRVECTTPPTVQLRRICAVLPAAEVPGTRKLVAVVAGQRVVEVAAAHGGRGAEVGRAHVGVVAGVRHADARPVETGISHRADVAVVARAQGWRTAAADAGAVTRRGGQAHVRARARRPLRCELAGGRAAVAVQRVAVVALLARLDHAVAADRGLLPQDGPEIRHHTARREPRTLDAEEVRATRA